MSWVHASGIVLIVSVLEPSAFADTTKPPSPVSMPSLDPQTEIHVAVTAAVGLPESERDCGGCIAGGALFGVGGTYAIADAAEVFVELPGLAEVGLGNPQAGIRSGIGAESWAVGGTLTTWLPVARTVTLDALTMFGLPDPNILSPIYGVRLSAIGRWQPTMGSFLQAEVALAMVADDSFAETRVEIQNLYGNLGVGGHVSDCWSLVGELRMVYVPHQQTDRDGILSIDDDMLVAVGIALERATRHESFRIRSHVAPYTISLGLDVGYSF